MDMENDVQVNLSEVYKVISGSDVLVIGFTLFVKRLLIDLRYDAYEGPFVQVVPPTNSVQERYQWLRRNRPRFPEPERFVFFVWPKRVEGLTITGVWDRIMQRCFDTGYRGVLRSCEEAYQELAQLEYTTMRDVIVGKHCQTLWERSKTGGK